MLIVTWVGWWGAVGNMGWGIWGDVERGEDKSRFHFYRYTDSL